MSKNNTNDDDNQNKGGRIPKLNAEFFTMKGNRTDELAILKMQFGAEGIDFYVSVFETLCESDYFTYPFSNKHYLALLAKKKGIDKDRFLEILQFCVEELPLFNKELYEKGYIFSEAFLNSFDSAGLFKNRTMSAEDVRNRVKELLSEVKQDLGEVNQNPASVKALKVKNSIANERESKEKEEERKKEKSTSKEERDLKETRESIKYSSEIPMSSSADDELPF